jgi:hypothetical protein
METQFDNEQKQNIQELFSLLSLPAGDAKNIQTTERLLAYLLQKNVLIRIKEPETEEEEANLFDTIIQTLRKAGENLPDYFDEPNICDDCDVSDALLLLNKYYTSAQEKNIMTLDNVEDDYIIAIVPQKHTDRIYVLSFQVGIPLVGLEPEEIGERGENINFSVATRALHITPDLERLKKYDEYPAKVRKQKLKNLFWFMIFAAPTATLIAKGYPWWSIIPGILAGWNFLWFIAFRNASPKAVYEKGLLIGAIITNENPLQIVAMAEMQTAEDDPVCWGLKRLDVKELPLHKIKKGERVPCAAMFGGAMPFAALWSEFEAHPACWATGDAASLEKAKRAIDETEWQTLETLAQKAAECTDIDFSKKVAYFNEDLSPRIDLQEKSEKT